MTRGARAAGASRVPGRWRSAARRAAVVAALLALHVPLVIGAQPTDVVAAAQGRDRPAGRPTPSEQVGPLGDPYEPQQWYLEEIGLGTDPPATGSGRVIAIVDSGVDLAHPDLEDAILRRPDGSVLGWDWVDGDDDPSDVLGHGTMVAGVALARAGNGVGTRGVAPGAGLMPLRVLDGAGRGDTTAIAEAITFALDNGADVVNLSFEAAQDVEVDDVAPVAAAISRAIQEGVVVVAAAGNTQAELTDFAPELGVLVVGATDRDGGRARFSAAGRQDLVMAPGVEIVSSWCRSSELPRCDGTEHSQGVADGTSYAAPQVSGAAALLLEAGLAGDQVVERLRQTARDLGAPGADALTGHGMLDIAAALGDWPRAPVPVPSDAPEVIGEAVELPTVSAPAPVEEAAAPTAAMAVVWTTAAVVLAVVAAVGGGLVAQRRVRPTGTVPDLRG